MHEELVSHRRSKNRSRLAHDSGQPGCLNKGSTKPEANMQTKRVSRLEPKQKDRQTCRGGGGGGEL